MWVVIRHFLFTSTFLTFRSCSFKAFQCAIYGCELWYARLFWLTWICVWIDQWERYGWETEEWASNMSTLTTKFKHFQYLQSSKPQIDHHQSLCPKMRHQLPISDNTFIQISSCIYIHRKMLRVLTEFFSSFFPFFSLISFFVISFMLFFSTAAFNFRKCFA